MVQLPAAWRWTVVPLTAQLPLALNVTTRPELAVALTLKSGAPNVLSPSGAKEITWVASAIANVCATAAARKSVVYAACEAVMVQLPTTERWTVVPLTVQLPLALNVTTKPELGVALTLK